MILKVSDNILEIANSSAFIISWFRPKYHEYFIAFISVFPFTSFTRCRSIPVFWFPNLVPTGYPIIPLLRRISLIS
jgi:hypothetical protein